MVMQITFLVNHIRKGAFPSSPRRVGYYKNIILYSQMTRDDD